MKMMIPTPTKRIDLHFGKITPEVFCAILSLSNKPEPEQWSTGHHYRRYPVRTGIRPVGHFQHHALMKATLQALFNLENKKLLHTPMYIVKLLF
jgi:hypothetical protein